MTSYNYVQYMVQVICVKRQLIYMSVHATYFLYLFEIFFKTNVLDKALYNSMRRKKDDSVQKICAFGMYLLHNLQQCA